MSHSANELSLGNNQADRKAMLVAPKPFHPVILGADIGIYNLARSLHEAYGVIPTVLAKMALGPVNNSKILDLILVDSQRPIIDVLLEKTPQIKAEHPNKELVLLCNGDTNVFEITQRAQELREHYHFAFPDYQTVVKTSGKSDFFRLATEHGMAVPPTLEVDLAQGITVACRTLQERLDQARAAGMNPESPLASVESFRFPLIVKANTSYGYEYVRWPGKKKVYTVNSLSEFEELLSQLKPIADQHEGMGRFVVQPRIAGNDTFNLSVTAFANRQGRVSMVNSAQVLLEDHSPTALGNPGAMIVQNMPVIQEQAIRFLEGIGWHGFANFDVKVDPNTGVAYFFEVNPRIGRNSYYNNIGGVNPMIHLIDDLLAKDFDRLHPGVERAKQRGLYYVLPLGVVKKYVDQRIWRKVCYLRQQGRAVSPLFNPAERELSIRFLRRLSYLQLNRLNHFRKFRQNYPVRVFEEQGTASLDTAELESAS